MHSKICDRAMVVYNLSYTKPCHALKFSLFCFVLFQSFLGSCYPSPIDGMLQKEAWKPVQRFVA